MNSDMAEPPDEDFDMSYYHEIGRVKSAVVACLTKLYQPSAWELLELIRKSEGEESLFYIEEAISSLASDSELSRMERSYFESLLHGGDLFSALNGFEAPGRHIASSIDQLLRQSAAYRSTRDFAEMLRFIARFRKYSPFNNMLVYTQNPSCAYFATEKHWYEKFRRFLKEDARPMVILAPRNPVLLVYDLDQTEGPPLPKELDHFAKFEGSWNPRLLKRAVDNAEKNSRIRVDFKTLSSTHGGFATTGRRVHGFKMRIAIHDGLNEPSRFGVLCHELAHIFLGHLDSDGDHWWPSRSGLSHKTKEFEAEAVAYLVTTRLGLEGNSARYLARFTERDAAPPAAVSMDTIAKVAGRIERMAKESLPERRPRFSS